MNRSPAICGGTAAASIYCAHVGAPAFRGPWDVWATAKAPHLLQKLDRSLSRLFEVGIELEPLLRRWLSEDLRAHVGQEVEFPTVSGWVGGHTDGLIATEDDVIGIAELKTAFHGSADWWIETETGRSETVPAQYEVQARWYLMIARHHYGPQVDRVEFLLMDNRTHTHRRTIEWDKAREDHIFSVVSEWWGRHILGEDAPPVDGSDMCRAALLAAKGEKVKRVGTEGEALLSLELDEARKARAQAQGAEELARNRLIKAIPAGQTLFEDGPVKSVFLGSKITITRR
jgi:hypothetical protein